ncbi:MAG: GC-type dockerin domain-anchored protein [Phycisphaerales bacterium JB060]
MMNTCVLRAFLACVCGLVLIQNVAFGQACDLGWTENLFPLAGVDGEVYATFTWDDGEGPAVYIGGDFTIAGSVNASNVASWDGERWEALGGGTDGIVHSFGVFDDGSGEALYVGGDFQTAGGLDAPHIARWDGSQWSGLDDGVNGPVYAMTTDDGRLYVGGEFGTASGTPARNLAWWDGDSWSGPPNGTSAPIHALLVHDDGAGERLFVGGTFIGVGGGVSARGIAAWDRATQVWSAVGGGVDGGVNALEVFESGSGDGLYAGGSFTTAGGLNAESIAQWDGVQWSGVGDGLDGGVLDLEVVDDGGTRTLLAVGPFEDAGGEFFGNGVARWDGADWSEVGYGLPVFFDWTPRSISAFEIGGQQRLLAGGNLPASNGVREFKGDAWADAVEAEPAAALVGGAPQTVYDMGSGPGLFLSGDFTIDGVTGVRAARWDGASAEALPWPGFISRGPLGMLGFDDGSGPAVYAAGAEDGSDSVAVMRWDGSGWEEVGDPPLLGSEGPMVVFDDGSGQALYVGGRGMTAGAASLWALARWDGATWSAVGGGLTRPTGSATVTALGVFDDGRGPALYAGGAFDMAGGVPARYVARWDGSTWEDAGSTLQPRSISAFEVYDSGEGPRLIAGGMIRFASGMRAQNIAQWDGERWMPVGSFGLDSEVKDLEVFDDGRGPALYAAGSFRTADGMPADRIARWDGLAWSEVDGGLDGATAQLVAYADAQGPALYVGGRFAHAGDVVSIELARYGCQPFECRADLDGDGELTIFDFLMFQNLFDAGDLAADFDGDGVLTLFDFLAFQNEFDAGC